MHGGRSPSINPLPAAFWDDLKEIALEAAKQSPISTLIIVCIFGLALAWIVGSLALRYLIVKEKNGSDYKNKEIQAKYALERYRAKLNHERDERSKSSKEPRG